MDDLNQELNTVNEPENPITSDPPVEPEPAPEALAQDSEIQPNDGSTSDEGAAGSPPVGAPADTEVAPSADAETAEAPENVAGPAVWMRSVDGDSIPIKCRCGRQLEKRDSHPDRYNAECPDPTCRLRYLVTDQGEEAVGRGI